MLPLLALGVGLAAGARAVGAAETAKKQKEVDAQAEITAAFQKELAKRNAEATFLASDAGRFLTAQDIEKAQNIKLQEGRAKNVTDAEAATAERKRVQGVVRDRRMLLGRDLNVDVKTTFMDTEGVVDPDATFFYRRINNWDDLGNPRMLSPEEGGQPYMDVSVGQFKPKGQNGGEKLTSAIAEISGKQYQWWAINKPHLANLWKNQLGSFFEQAANQYSRGLDADDPRMATGRLPRIPVSLANQVADAYGAELAIELIEQVYDDARPGEDGTTVRENLANTFSYVYGMSVNKKDVIPKKVVQLNPATGEEEIVVTINDDVLQLDAKETPAESAIIMNVGQNIGYGASTPHDTVVSAVNSMGTKLNKQGRTVMDDVIATRTVFREFRDYPIASAQATASPWNVFEKGISTDEKGPQMAYAKYWNENQLFVALDDADSLGALTLLAPKNSISLETSTSQNPPVGRNAIYPKYKDRTIAAVSEEAKKFEEFMEAKYLAGAKRSDVAQKGLAAKQASQVAGALEVAYSNESAALSGTVGGAVSTFQGFLAQFDYIIKAIELSNDSVETKQKLKEKVTGYRDQLTTDVNKGGLEGAAGATAVKGYYEGVLVYSMALALQGGNAAARTVSDADIERIQRLLNFGKSLDDPNQKAAVMRAVKRAMDRQATMADFYTSDNEAHVWAAYTADQTFIRTGQGRKDYLIATLEMEVNNITNGAFYNQNPSAKSSSMPSETNIGGQKFTVNPDGSINI